MEVNKLEDKKYLDSDGLVDVLTRQKAINDRINAELFYQFSSATDENLVSIIQAADAGKIDLYEDYGWRVGDEREVTLTTNEKVVFVLMDRGSVQTFDLVINVKNKDGSTRTKPSFVVGLKNCLYTKMNMNSTATNTGSWNSCERRTWLNNTFRGQIPSSIRGIFKQFKCKTANEYSGSSITVSTDYFALPAEKEVFGKKAYCTDAEAAALIQFDYYVVTNHRLKRIGENAASTDNWFERSPFRNNAYYFCSIGNNGSAFTSNASDTYGISPFGCI